MKIRNAFVTLTICLLLVLTTTFLVNMQKVSAQPITDCRKIVTGTYLVTVTVSGNFDKFPSIVTFTQDGNYFATSSNQSSVASVPSYGNIQGRWKCTSSTEITTTAFNFDYPTATLPGTISRTDLHATFDPKNGVVQATATLKSFALNANPLNDDAPVARTFTFTGQRVKP
ncbi:hypothetical protein [Nostoc sp.]|uniref:hypothetical protein n=1 Tax=Nostoc sp. TaxID=1180 RepID=UPI002FFA2AB2